MIEETLRNLVCRLRDRYGLRYMVETGTTYGRNATACAELFERVYTIELDPHLCECARRMCAGFRNVEVIFGNSAHALPVLLPRLDVPVLFWLDAHWTGDENPQRAEECPLMDELRLIGQHSARDAILIDDARLLVNPPPPPHDPSQWPTMEEIAGAIAVWPVAMAVEVHDDLIQVTPA